MRWYQAQVPLSCYSAVTRHTLISHDITVDKKYVGTHFQFLTMVSCTCVHALCT